ncbi:MAG: CBS domain-containing protein [Desulfobacteraceae bacterium]|nr:MAG: CBS domain-containing protein [Desulfobacteraceae bacterium]
MKTAEEIVLEKGGEIVSVTSGTSLYDALKLMVQKNVGSVVVMDAGEPKGIWTARNLMKDTLAEGFDPKAAGIERHMNACACTAPHTDTIYDLMDKFLGLRTNHLLIEKEGRHIGLLSSGDVIKATIQDKTEELKKLNSMFSWQYYEEWRWKPRK